MITLPPHARLTYGSLDAPCIFIRGLPGSGKSTLAQEYVKVEYIHLEADMYFIQPDGSYQYDVTKIREAHVWCRREMRRNLKAYRRVVISNTFTALWELDEYKLVTPKYLKDNYAIIVCSGTWENVHNVPEHILQRMKDRWED